jgi:hypothetical protein
LERFRLWSVLASSLAEIVDLERGVSATVYGLSVRPARVVRDYWRRCTRPYVNPVRYFLFAITVLQIALWQTGAAQGMVEGFLAGSQDAADGDPDSLAAITSRAQALEIFGDYFTLFFVAGILILAGVSWIGSARNIAEELIFHLFVWGHIALAWALLNVAGHAIPALGGSSYGAVVLLTSVGYYAWADATAHQPDVDRSLARSLVEALATLLLFAFAYAALSGFVVGLLTSALS